MGWKAGLACCKECWAGCGCGCRRRRFALGRLGSCLIGLAVDLTGERGSSSVLSPLAGGLGDTRRGLGLGKIRDSGENMAGVGVVVATCSRVNSTLLVLTLSGNWVVAAAGNEGEAGRTNGTGVGEKRGMDWDPIDVGSFGFPSWKNWKFPRPSRK